jgi:hypothetical protein
MTGTFPFLKQLGGHNTVEDLAIGIPAAALGGLGLAGGLGALGGAGAAFGDPTAAALAGAGTDVGAAGVPAAAGLVGAAPGAPGAGAGAIGFGGDVASAAPDIAGFPAASNIPAFGASTAGFTSSGLPLTSGGLIDTSAMGIPDIGNVAAYGPDYGATTGAATAAATPADTALGLPAGWQTGAATVPGGTPAMGGPFGNAAVPYAGLGMSGAPPPGALPPSLAQSLGLSGLGNWVSANPGTAALLGLGGASLGAQLLNKQSGVPYLQQQQNLIGQQQALAGQEQAYGQALQQPLLTGQLPPGQQEAVAKGLQDAISTIKGRYDALNLTGSSMEADAIANAKNTAVLAGVQIEQQMAQTGQSAITSAASALGAEASVYNTIMNAVLQQDQNLANAVSGFANAAAFGTAVGAARQPTSQ